MSLPTPEQPVPGFQSGYAIVAALDLLGRRWILRILWELRNGPIGFRALQAFCDQMSPSMLSQRLSLLQTTGLIYHIGKAPTNRNGQQPASARACRRGAEWRAIERTGRNRAAQTDLKEIVNRWIVTE